jgi:CRISPR-associated endonuclease Csn1
MQKLPKDTWTFDSSLQQNEMFILGMPQEDFERVVKENDKKLLSKYFYKLRSIAYEPQIDCYFEHHLETMKNKSEEAKFSKRYILIKSTSAFEKLNPKKVRIDSLGELVSAAAAIPAISNPAV